MASPAMLTVSAIMVTLNTKATIPWAVTVLRMVREVRQDFFRVVNAPDHVVEFLGDAVELRRHLHVDAVVSVAFGKSHRAVDG